MPAVLVNAVSPIPPERDRVATIVLVPEATVLEVIVQSCTVSGVGVTPMPPKV
ncbi:hypothetical protein [Chryseobacterium indoltheticum]|uniref:hypothetical protein n=1 Tax=Chryseobacterium indoltheticum TaxID=254 RepID=UPI003F495F1F